MDKKSNASKEEPPQEDANTFVTGVNIERPDEKQVVLAQLERCVDGIEDQFVTVLKNHENDFLQAYRVS